MNWIPMTKQKPSTGGYYLVTYCVKYKEPMEAQFYVEVDYWDDLGEFWEVYRADVIAWAELPSPYKAERKEE